MNRKQIERYRYWLKSMIRLGIGEDDIEALRRIEMTLHRWHEMECGVSNGHIERDETTGKVYWINADNDQPYLFRDRESGALKRLAAILSRYPHLGYYVQHDPRGGALYLYDKAYKLERYPTITIDGCYSSVGVYCNYK